MKRARGIQKKNPYSDFTKSNTFVDPYNYKCPVCGRNMAYTSMYEATGHGSKAKDALYCAKDNMIGRTWRSVNGNVHLKSTPADLDTRCLRIEAHYYLDMIVDSGLLPGKDSVYMWLTQALGFPAIGHDFCKHIGEMDAMMCKKTIEQCLNYIAENKERFGRNIVAYNGARSYTRTRLGLQEIINTINDHKVDDIHDGTVGGGNR